MTIIVRLATFVTKTPHWLILYLNVACSHPIPVHIHNYANLHLQGLLYAKTCIGGISVYMENSEMGKIVSVNLSMSQAIPI